MRSRDPRANQRQDRKGPIDMNMMSRNWRDLIRPKAISVAPESLTDFYGKFTCEPLERGFGKNKKREKKK